MIPVELDGAAHREWRRVIGTFFTSSYAARQEPLMRRICREFLAGFAGDGRCDLVADFTGHLPTTVFLLSVLGMPAEDAKWLRETLHGFLVGTEEERAEAYGKFAEYVLRHLELRRNSPPRGGDLIDTVLAAEIDGAPTTPADQLSCVLTMVAAAIDATSSFLAAGIYHFATHPDHTAAALADPATMHSAIEEILRVYAPSWMNVKRVTRDVEIGGRRLKRGDLITLSPAGACRDPRVFPDPLEVHLGEQLPPHASFGFGPHHCPGAPLARDLGRIVFTEVLTSLPDLRVAAEPTLTTHYLRSWTSLPVTFTPCEITP
jgi:cytochrome P450